MSLIPQPFIQLNNAAGAAYAGAKAYFTQTGTTTAIVVYQDNLLTSPHINPVVADSEGRFPVIFAPESPALRMRIISATGSLAAPMLDIDPVTTVSGASSLGVAGINLVLNPAMTISEEFGTINTSIADDIYDLDQWYSLTQTAACQVQQIKDPESGFTYYRRQTQNQAVAQRMGFAQILEGVKCKHLRGGNATLVPRIRISSGQKLNYAILGWTSAEDIVTSDVVLSWTSSTFTPGNFFLAANYSVLGVGSVTPSADTWTPGPELTAAMGTAFNNVVLFVWSDQVMAQNATLDCDYVMFEQGDTFTGYPSVDPQQELSKCLRHCYIWNSEGAATGLLCSSWGNTSPGQSQGLGRYPTKMRTIPSSTQSGTNLTWVTFPGGGTTGGVTAGVDGSSTKDVMSLTASAIAVPATGWLQAGSATSRIKFSSRL